MTEHEAAAGFSTLLETMAQLDFFTLVLPFVLSYVILLFAIRQIDLFNEQKGVPELISIISAFFVAQFIAVNPWYQTFFVDYFGRLTIGIMGILGLMILLGLFGWDLKIFRRPVMVLVMISIAGAAFTAAGGFGPPLHGDIPMEFGDIGSILIDSGLIWLLIIAGVLWWTAKGDEDSDGDSTPLIDQILRTEVPADDG